MSIAQFDDFYDICCSGMEEEVELVRVEVPMETPVMAEAPVLTKWWEEALKEIERVCENEFELFYS